MEVMQVSACYISIGEKQNIVRGHSAPGLAAFGEDRARIRLLALRVSCLVETSPSVLFICSGGGGSLSVYRGKGLQQHLPSGSPQIDVYKQTHIRAHKQTHAHTNTHTG